ncbi:MAG: hypothetical protein H6573_29190 [Lewinellaceae bacterium]|nr:hypothetical protein [Lewinellaceae bacterium]
MHFHADQGHLSEETALKEAILKASHGKMISAFLIEGYKAASLTPNWQRNRYYLSTPEGCARYDLLHPHWQDDGYSDTESLEFIQDSAVHLYESNKKSRPPNCAWFNTGKASGQVLSFVTNLWDLPAVVSLKFIASGGTSRCFSVS